MRNTATEIDPRVAEQQRLIPEIQALLLGKLSIQVDSPDTDLFQQGALDSLGQVHLLMHLEKHFGLHLPMEELELNSFHSVRNIAELVANSMAARNGWGSLQQESVDARAPGSISLSAVEILEQQNLILEIQMLLSEKLTIRVESAETDLFQAGLFDSMTLVQFILQMEEHFGFHLPMEDLEPDWFRSVSKIAELVARRTQSADTPGARAGART